MTHLKCAAVKIQKVVCGFVVRRILQQAAAQTKEKEATKNLKALAEETKQKAKTMESNTKKKEEEDKKQTD